MDVLLIFMALGFIGGGSAVGIAWVVWWHFESRKPLWPYQDGDAGG